MLQQIFYCLKLFSGFRKSIIEKIHCRFCSKHIFGMKNWIPLHYFYVIQHSRDHWWYILMAMIMAWLFWHILHQKYILIWSRIPDFIDVHFSSLGSEKNKIKFESWHIISTLTPNLSPIHPNGWWFPQTLCKWLSQASSVLFLLPRGIATSVEVF